MKKNRVIIYKANKEWNWKYFDDCLIGIYGKGFISKEETIKDFERYSKETNIENYDLEITDEI